MIKFLRYYLHKFLKVKAKIWSEEYTAVKPEFNLHFYSLHLFYFCDPSLRKLHDPYRTE